jgi:hypothetical protein
MVIHYTYDSTVRRELVGDIVSNVAIRKTPFVSSLSTDTVDETEFKPLTDTYESSGDNARIEGSDPTYPALTDPTKGSQITQILSKPFKISWSKLNSAHHGMTDNWSYQKVKKTVALKKDLERTALFGTAASGTGSAARRMKGLISLITSYKDGSSYSGKDLTASIFNAVSSAIWTQSEELGGIILVGSYQKRRISEHFASFDSANQRIVNTGDRQISIPIDQISADFGTYEVMASHEMQSVLPGSLVVFQPEFHKVVYLQNSEPQAVEYAPTGMARQGEVWTEASLWQDNELPNGVVENLKSS